MNMDQLPIVQAFYLHVSLTLDGIESFGRRDQLLDDVTIPVREHTY